MSNKPRVWIRKRALNSRKTSYHLRWACDRIYRGHMELIANDVKMCCAEAGDCPADVPLP